MTQPEGDGRAATIATRLRKPPHVAITTADSMPTLNAISLTVSIHTSSPNVRTTMSGREERRGDDEHEDDAAQEQHPPHERVAGTYRTPPTRSAT